MRGLDMSWIPEPYSAAKPLSSQVFLLRELAALAFAMLCAGDVSNSLRWRIIGPGGGGTMFHPAISPHDPNLAVLNCDMTGAYITKDGGTSWREFNLRTTVGAFAFDPVQPNILYAGSDGVFRSDDRGGRGGSCFQTRRRLKSGW